MSVDTNSMEFHKAVAAEVAKQLAEEVSKIKGIGKMGYKNTMNFIDVREYHKMLEIKTPLKDISQILLVNESTLKKFTPKIVDEVNARKKEAMRLALEARVVKPSAGAEFAPKANLTEKQQAKQDKVAEKLSGDK